MRAGAMSMKRCLNSAAVAWLFMMLVLWKPLVSQARRQATPTHSCASCIPGATILLQQIWLPSFRLARLVAPTTQHQVPLACSVSS